MSALVQSLRGFRFKPHALEKKPALPTKVASTYPIKILEMRYNNKNICGNSAFAQNGPVIGSDSS
jgi:hypothetical protein